MNIEDMRSHFASTPTIAPQRVPVVVLAGGKGSRLRASSDAELRNVPKMLVTVDRDGANEPMLGAALRRLSQQGFRRITLLTSADPDSGGQAIETFVWKRFGRHLDLAVHREVVPLGTAGAVYAALAHIREEIVVVMPGDTVFPCELLPDALLAHGWSGSQLTWVVTSAPGPDAQNAGRVLVDPATNHVTFALEGIDHSLPVGVLARLLATTSTGVLVANRSFFRSQFERYLVWLDQPAATDIYRQFVPWLVSHGEVVSAYDIRQAAPDLGTPDRLTTFGRKGARDELHNSNMRGAS